MTTMDKPSYIIGSISSGTMREEDLIPCFLDTLEQLNPSEATSIREEYSDLLSRLSADEMTSEDQDEASCLLNETLFDALGNCAPPYFYFGSHPGDGADYGFWLSEEFEELFKDDGGLKVSDLSKVPADYSGDVLHVSDHGNPTLYSATNGKLTEVWSLV
jgi:hypothetical protein